MFRKNKNSFFLITLFFFSGFFLIHYYCFSFYPYIANYSSYCLYPVLFVQNKVVTPIKSFLEKRRTVQELNILVNSLQKKNELLLSENIYLKSEKLYINQAKELLDFKKRYSQNIMCCAQIIFRQNSKQGNFILVDRGSTHGIEKNMISVYKNSLIGFVSDVYPWYSKVLLITDSQCKVAACCVKTGAEGIHMGINSQKNSLMSKINILHDVKIGDLVISSGSGLIFPQGFALGKVVSVKKNDIDYSAKIEPLIDVHSIRHCLLMARS